MVDVDGVLWVGMVYPFFTLSFRVLELIEG
jgi:hypothetical protein